MKLLKYSNRKLYRPNIGYINMTEVAKYIAEGGEIEVKCMATRLDVTEEVVRRCINFKKTTLDEIYAFLRK